MSKKMDEAVGFQYPAGYDQAHKDGELAKAWKGYMGGMEKAEQKMDTLNVIIFFLRIASIAVPIASFMFIVCFAVVGWYLHMFASFIPITIMVIFFRQWKGLHDHLKVRRDFYAKECSDLINCD